MREGGWGVVRIKKEKPPLDKTEAKIQTNKKIHLEVQDDAGQVNVVTSTMFHQPTVEAGLHGDQQTQNDRQQDSRC